MYNDELRNKEELKKNYDTKVAAICVTYIYMIREYKNRCWYLAIS